MKSTYNKLEKQANQMVRSSYEENINLIKKGIDKKIKSSKRNLKIGKEGQDEVHTN